MDAPKRIVVVDDDSTLRSLIARALAPPEFEVHVFGDPRDALMKLHDIRPDLIVSDVLMPDMDGRTFFKVVKRSRDLRDVPFLFLSGMHSSDEIVATLEDGADDFVNKPFELHRFVAKVRATLRMVHRLSAEAREDWLSGTIGAAGTLPLVKYCEDRRLTGRLTVESAGLQRFMEFLGGELVHAGGVPGEDALDALMTVRAGTYLIQQKRLDAEDLRRVESRVLREEKDRQEPGAEEGPPPVPGGRLSRVEVRGQSLEIQTEGENRPNFTVTTVIVRGGHVVRKVETSWQHPLLRREDAELARSQIERQHERVVATIRELAVEAPRRPEGGAPRTVDGSLLAWAVSFVAEQARDHLGSVMTVTLLRRTHGRLAREREDLRSFRILEDGRVASAGAGLSETAVGAVAAWTAAFLADAGSLVEKVGRIRVRHATKMMEADLERCGFYAAFEAAGGKG